MPIMFDDLIKGEEVRVEGYTKKDGTDVEGHVRGGSSSSPSKGELTIQGKSSASKSLARKIKLNPSEYVGKVKQFASSPDGKKWIDRAVGLGSAAADVAEAALGGDFDPIRSDQFNALVEWASTVAPVYKDALIEGAKSGKKAALTIASKVFFKKSEQSEMTKMAEIDEKAIQGFMEKLMERIDDEQKSLVVMAVGLIDEIPEGEEREGYIRLLMTFLLGRASEEQVKELQEFWLEFGEEDDESGEKDFDTLPESDDE